MSSSASLYRWFQDNASITVDVFVPAGTLPTQLKLLLTRKRLTLRNTEGEPLLRRKLFSQINPPCTDKYTMPDVKVDGRGTVTVLRVVLYKAVQAGWISLFAGDPPSRGLVPSPAPLSHAMVHVAALARAKEASSREAAVISARARTTSTSSRPEQSWRHGCHPVPMKTPGGIKIHYKRDPAIRTPPPPTTTTPTTDGAGVNSSEDENSALPPHCCVRHSWSVIRRVVPEASPVEVMAEWEAAARERLAAAAEEAASAEEEASARVPSRAEAEAAKKAIEAIRGGATPQMRAGGGGGGGGGTGTGGGMGGDGGESSSDDEDYERWEGGGAHPDDIEYPLPGSDATCDSCAQCVNKYYHCVQCGVLKGFDLCEQCHRMGIYPDKHRRRYPNHTLSLVTPHTAPLIAKPQQLQKAPPAPPPPMPPPGSTAVSERVIIPLEAKVKYEWSQYSGEINLSVALPQGTRARDLIVVVQPFSLSVSLKGYGVILKGSLHKGVRHRETVWTIEEGMLRLMLVKSDQQSWKKLFPHEDAMHPMEAIRQVCEDPEPVSHSYMDLDESGRQLVDLHRSHKHAMATGDVDYATELEEEMKMMRFNWGKKKDHMEA